MTKVVHPAKNDGQAGPKLKMTSYQAFQGKRSIAAPTQDKINGLAQSGVLIRERIINNPPNGNCCFHAFAIGLIDKIQEESISNKKDLFEHWLSLDSSLREHYNAICAFDLDRPNLALLNRLQSSLRLITHNGQVAALKKACANPADDYRKLVGNETYVKFAEFYHNRRVDRRFNEFAASTEIGEALHGLQSEVIPNFEHLTLVPLFLSLIYGKDVQPKSITPETNPSVRSPVIAAMRVITQDYFWGAHHDLNFLASVFKVNLHCLQNGRAPYVPVDLPGRHVIKVNHGGAHWTTLVARPEVRPDIPFNAPGATLRSEPLKEYQPGAGAVGEKRKTNEHTKKALSTQNQLISTRQDASPSSSIAEPSPSYTMRPKKVVRFLFSPSQLENQRRRNLGVFDNKVFKKEAEPQDADIERLEFLRGAVSRATIAYIEYSEGIWFSLFHRHGKTGRVRARTFHEQFLGVEDLADAKKNLVLFLANDNNNGNTYPHSFRTMLLQELQAAPRTLQYTSEHFDNILDELALVLSVPINTLRL